MFKKGWCIMSLGEFLREKRLEKDWSQRDLAAASGISNAEISRLEAGKRKEPSASVLQVLAKALDTPVEELLKQAGLIEAGEAFVTQHLSDPVSSFSASSSYLSIDDLSEEEIADVKEYITFLKSKRK